METSTSKEGTRVTHLDGKQFASGRTSRQGEPGRDQTPSKLSASAKRKRNSSREHSRDRRKVPVKRICQTPVASSNQLCEQCSKICWDGFYTWMTQQHGITWKGLAVDWVGKRYREDLSSSSCSLCRQLYAPWILPFLKKRNPKQWRSKDLGDRIHIFQHLRHLPDVSDFYASRKVLRENHAPFHIAVVPHGSGWKEDFRTHVAIRGMVVVMPRGMPDPELFVPQQVSKKFDPGVVRPWLKFCKDHSNHCHAKPPEVKGMKLIDCKSKDLNILEHRQTDKYLALSYVWGKPDEPETKEPMPVAKEAPRGKENMDIRAKTPQPVARKFMPPQRQLKKSNLVRKKSALQEVPTKVPRKRYQPSSVPARKVISKLPKDVPLTIRDAIRVTKGLGFRFLWVDKYCIDQDNEAEKRQQCGLMGDIYGGSLLTIFALGPDSKYGLPGVSTRERSRRLPCTSTGQYDLVSTMEDPHLAIRQAMWSSRGWTYQEGLFSTRRLFFTDHQVYFECNSMNCAESFKTNLATLHTQNRERFRAYHRAGQFVCGNSNPYSHLKVSRSKQNHRKIDTIRRCQYQIQQFTKRQLTNKDDILNAFAGIARFYARTTARIISLAGIPIPFPIANLPENEREHLDHLSYALAWTHRIRTLGSSEQQEFDPPEDPTLPRPPWNPDDNPAPQRRQGFPSWSWAGWFGAIGWRQDLPYRWTSHLSSVRIGFRDSGAEEYTWLNSFAKYKQFLIERLLTATQLSFDAYVLDPSMINFWARDPDDPSRQIASDNVWAYMSLRCCPLERLQHRLMTREFECVVLGTHGEPRRDVYRAIQAADKKSPKALKKRIDMLERTEPDSIVCLIVYTNRGKSYRVGLLKVVLGSSGKDFTLHSWGLREKRRFILG